MSADMTASSDLGQPEERRSLRTSVSSKTVTREPIQMNPWKGECPEPAFSTFTDRGCENLNFKFGVIIRRLPQLKEKQISKTPRSNQHARLRIFRWSITKVGSEAGTGVLDPIKYIFLHHEVISRVLCGFKLYKNVQ